jgi:hypothetical protein
MRRLLVVSAFALSLSVASSSAQLSVSPSSTVAAITAPVLDSMHQ